jgi:hypothetical protein
MSELPSGWVTIRGAGFWRLVWSAPGQAPGYSFFAWALLFQGAAQAVSIFLREDHGLFVSIAVIVVAALGVTSVVLFATARDRSPSFNLDTGQMRVGRRVWSFDDIAEAEFLTVIHRGRRESYLRLGKGVAKGAIVCLISSNDRAMTDAEREVVAEVLRRSPIEIPTSKPDPYDPHGRFATLDYPNHLTRDEAIEFVLHTPESGEPVRAPRGPKRKSIWIDEDD